MRRLIYSNTGRGQFDPFDLFPGDDHRPDDMDGDFFVHDRVPWDHAQNPFNRRGPGGQPETEERF